MDPDTDVCQTEQPQISYSVDFTAEQSSAMESPILILLAVGSGGVPSIATTEALHVQILMRHAQTFSHGHGPYKCCS